MTEPATNHDEDVDFPACYRHPDVEMAVRCARCGRPICADCMIDADVGFHCPECARKGAKESPTVRAPWQESQGVLGQYPVTIALIALNVVVYVFVLATSSPNQAAVAYGLQPGFTGTQGLGEWWRVGTSMFLHGSLWHLGFNMFVLFVFGRILEPAFGRWWFLTLYVASGLIGSAAYMLIVPATGAPAVGASGAIFGLFGAMLALGLRRRHTPQGKFLLQQMVGLLILNLLFTFAIAGVAWQAHVGGFVAGVALGWLYDVRTDWVLRVAGAVAAILVTAAIVVAKPIPFEAEEWDRFKQSRLTELSQLGDGRGVDARADLAERGLEVDRLD